MSNLPDPFAAFFNHSQNGQAFAGKFIKHIEEGVEYYTDSHSGRSGMSHIGLARFVGKTQPALTHWVRKISAADPINNDLPECFKPFAGKSLKLINNADSEGAEILPDDFCSAVVMYYACFANPKDQSSEAKLALLVCTAMGLRVHIQTKTGWKQPLPAEPQQTSDRPILHPPSPLITNPHHQALILKQFTAKSAIALLQAIKPLLFHQWKQKWYTINDELLRYFDCELSQLRGIVTRHRPALDGDGFKTLTGDGAKHLREAFKLNPCTNVVNSWTALNVLRLAMVIDTPIAAQVRAKLPAVDPSISIEATEPVAALNPTPAVTLNPTPIAATPIDLAVEQRLEQLERVVNLSKQLDGFNEGQQRQFRAELLHTINVTTTRPRAPLPSDTTPYAEVSLSGRATEQGYRLDRLQLKAAGLLAAQAYRYRYGCNPLQRSQLIDNVPVNVNRYTAADLDLIDAAIQAVLEA